MHWHCPINHYCCSGNGLLDGHFLHAFGERGSISGPTSTIISTIQLHNIDVLENYLYEPCLKDVYSLSYVVV